MFGNRLSTHHPPTHSPCFTASAYGGYACALSSMCIRNTNTHHTKATSFLQRTPKIFHSSHGSRTNGIMILSPFHQGTTPTKHRFQGAKHKDKVHTLRGKFQKPERATAKGESGEEESTNQARQRQQSLVRRGYVESTLHQPSRRRNFQDVNVDLSLRSLKRVGRSG